MSCKKFDDEVRRNVDWADSLAAIFMVINSECYKDWVGFQNVKLFLSQPFVLAGVFLYLLTLFDKIHRVCQGNLLHFSEFTCDSPGADLSLIDSVAGLLQLLFGFG